MGLDANSGPHISYGVLTPGSTDGLTVGSNTTPASYNDQRAPDVSDLGYAMMDPRAAYNYYPGGAVTNKTYAFQNSRAYVDYTPLAASSIAIVSVTASSSIAGTALKLQAASSARGTYSVSLIAPESGATVTTNLTFDSSAIGLSRNSFGASGTVNTWAAGWGAGRCVSVATSTYSDSPVLVVGRDVYGYKIAEYVPISSAGSGAAVSSFGGCTQKAFKHITAVYNSSTPVSSGIAVGTSDRFGLPFYTPYLGQNITVSISSADLVQGAAIALSSANCVLAAASTATQTSTTADVRGIYISSAAPLAGAYRLQIAITPSASALVTLGTTNVAPLFGAPQYSSI